MGVFIVSDLLLVSLATSKTSAERSFFVGVCVLQLFVAIWSFKIYCDKPLELWIIVACEWKFYHATKKYTY